MFLGKTWNHSIVIINGFPGRQICLFVRIGSSMMVQSLPLSKKVKGSNRLNRRGLSSAEFGVLSLLRLPLTVQRHACPVFSNLSMMNRCLS